MIDYSESISINYTNNVLCSKYEYSFFEIINQNKYNVIYKGKNIPKEGEKLIHYALKKIKIGNLSDLSYKKYINEKRNLQKYKLKNIVKYEDSLSDDINSVFVITKYCNGGNLSSFILKNKLDIDEIITKFTEIVRSVNLLHSNQIFHGSLCPENILLHKNKIKITGFSLVNLNKIDLWNAVKESPYFYAPEIINQEDFSKEADIWSLGVIFYFMIYKKVPWISINLKEFKNLILYKGKIEFNEINNIYISQQIIDLIEKMLYPDKNKRITMKELLQDLVFMNRDSLNIKIKSESNITLNDKKKLPFINKTDELISIKSIRQMSHHFINSIGKK